MIVCLDKSGHLRIDEDTDFRRFKVLISQGTLTELRETPPDGLRFQGAEHAFVSIDFLKQWGATHHDDTWLVDLDKMIAFAREHGWLDGSGRKIRAHIELQ
jgi:hypothetical protein